MSTLPSPKMLTWIGRKCQVPHDGSPAVTRFELLHQSSNGSSEIIDSYPPIAGTDATSEDLASAIWQAAEDDAEVRTGQFQRYVVLTYRQDSEEPDARFAFNFNSRGVGNPHRLGDGSEPATPEGLQGQLMRHAERASTLAAEMAENMNIRLIKEVESLASRAAAADEARNKAFILNQELLDRKVDRDINLAEAQQRMRRTDQIIEFMVSLAPLLIAKFMGTGQLPGGIPAPGNVLRDNALGNLFKKLSQEEVMGILGALQPENKALVFELYKSHAEDFQKAEEQKPPIMRTPTMDPETPTH